MHAGIGNKATRQKKPETRGSPTWHQSHDPLASCGREGRGNRARVHLRQQPLSGGSLSKTLRERLRPAPGNKKGTRVTTRPRQSALPTHRRAPRREAAARLPGPRAASPPGPREPPPRGPCPGCHCRRRRRGGAPASPARQQCPGRNRPAPAGGGEPAPPPPRPPPAARGPRRRSQHAGARRDPAPPLSSARLSPPPPPASGRPQPPPPPPSGRPQPPPPPPGGARRVLPAWGPRPGRAEARGREGRARSGAPGARLGWLGGPGGALRGGARRARLPGGPPAAAVSPVWRNGALRPD